MFTRATDILLTAPTPAPSCARWATARSSPTRQGGPHDGRRSTLTLTVRFGLNPIPDVDGEGVQHLIGVAGNGATFPDGPQRRGRTEFTGPVFSHDVAAPALSPVVPTNG